MKVVLFFVFISGALIVWRYTPRRTRTTVRKAARKNVLSVVAAVVVTTALLALAFMTQGRII